MKEPLPVEIRFCLNDIMKKHNLKQMDIQDMTDGHVKQGVVSRMLQPGRLRFDMDHLIMIIRALNQKLGLNYTLDDLFQVTELKQ